MMKGGITSGVVYPLAACELARTRKFVNIGGSSAGAIAACVVAAAGVRARRRRFQPVGRRCRTQIGPTLPKLFTRGTADAHRACRAHGLARSEGDSRRQDPASARSRWCGRSGPRFALGVLVSAVVAVAAAFALVGVPGDAASGARFGIVVAVGRGDRRDRLRRLGGGGGSPCHADRTWRSRASACASGRTARTRTPPTSPDPARSPTGCRRGSTSWQVSTVRLLVVRSRAHEINLQVMTTDLTHGRPMCFPFTGRRVPVRPRGAGAYFPPPVIDALSTARSRRRARTA